MTIAVIVTVLLAEVIARVVSANVPETIRWYDASAQLKIAQMDESDHVDVVFAGTSMAWQGLVPAAFSESDGRSAYNAGLAGGVPLVMERWLLEEVVPRLSPTTVVWGISSLDLSPSYGAENRERYDDALETRQGALAAVERFAAGFSSLVRDRTVLRDTAQAWGEAAQDRETSFTTASEELGDDGERLGFDIDLSAERGAVQQARLRDFSIDAEDVASIERTIAELQEMGIEVILVEMPVPDRFVASHPNGSDDYQLVRQALGSIATLHQIRLISLEDRFSDTDFVDFTHLDRDSSLEFTAAVAAAISIGRNDAVVPASDTRDIAGASASGAACRTEFVVDEYGIAVEVEICEGSPEAEEDPTPETTPLVPARSLSEWLDRPEAIELAGYLRDRLAYQEGCGRPPTLDDRMQDAVATLPDTFDVGVLARLEQAVDRMDQACIENPAAWQIELETAIETAAELGEALGSDSVAKPTYGTDEVTERTAMATAVVDSVYSWTAGSDEFEVSFFWHSAADLRFAQMRREAIVTDTRPEVLIVGSSIAARALDPGQLSVDIGKPVANMSVPGAAPEAYAAWLPEWLDDTEARSVVWGLSAHRLMSAPGRCDNASSGNPPRSATAPLEARELLFGRVPSLQDQSTLDLALGPANGAAYANTYLGAVLDAKWEANGLIPKENGFQGVTDSHRSLYAENITCEAVFGLIFESVDSLLDQGIEVTIVLIPSHDEIRALNYALITQLEETLTSYAASIGLEVVTLAGPLTDGETYDGVHANIVGRDRLSSELGASLAAP